MKKISINLLTNVVLLLAGLLLIIFHRLPNLLDWVARIMGVMFLLPSLAYLLTLAMRHAPVRVGIEFLGVLPAVGGVCFGVVMLMKSAMFGGLLSVFMGALLIVLGLFHLVFLFLSRNVMKVMGSYYFLPLIVTVCGVLILFVESLRESVSTIVLLTGICLLLFNITSLQEYLAERKARRTAVTLPRIDDEDEVHTTTADDTGRHCDVNPEDEQYLHVEV